MKARLLVAAVATVLIGTAVPVLAEEIGVGVGPVGVTVGEGHRDREVVREREVIRDRDGRRDCPSADNLRLVRCFEKEGSGSSGLEFRRPAADAASVGLR
jgi:hypothetical protein